MHAKRLYRRKKSVTHIVLLFCPFIQSRPDFTTFDACCNTLSQGTSHSYFSSFLENRYTSTPKLNLFTLLQASRGRFCSNMKAIDTQTCWHKDPKPVALLEPTFPSFLPSKPGFSLRAENSILAKTRAVCSYLSLLYKHLEDINGVDRPARTERRHLHLGVVSRLLKKALPWIWPCKSVWSPQQHL